VISVEDSESQINLLVWYYGQYVQVMNFKGNESCLHYLDREMFEKTVALMENQSGRELMVES